MKLECLFLFFVVLGYAVARKDVNIMVGWSPIKDINDPFVTEIANFTVTEYDKRSGQTLKLEKVIKEDTQVVAGINYYLTLAASDGSSSNNYKAIVWEKAWLHFEDLTSFTPVHG